MPYRPKKNSLRGGHNDLNLIVASKIDFLIGINWPILGFCENFAKKYFLKACTSCRAFFRRAVSSECFKYYYCYKNKNCDVKFKNRKVVFLVFFVSDNCLWHKTAWLVLTCLINPLKLRNLFSVADKIYIPLIGSGFSKFDGQNSKIV